VNSPVHTLSQFPGDKRKLYRNSLHGASSHKMAGSCSGVQETAWFYGTEWPITVFMQALLSTLPHVSKIQFILLTTHFSKIHFVCPLHKLQEENALRVGHDHLSAHCTSKTTKQILI